MLLAIRDDLDAVDILHREVRHAVAANAAIEQARDVRMWESRQNLPFREKTLQ